ncbi:hypothetical protein Loa_00211 [Legionella oakridgensis ATCC 33761 = DSM 21215]|uniref:Uncharacterized protein n=1 Tax=Legionella oakridgensis ATCC 33761 = DSM 21215 TaxID=1268635 RepID=W0B7I6_9GAMM|nr:hypothetical protein Loa_00211 [Legionella oakridgensis ATCC 33761 = DSM 21215]
MEFLDFCKAIKESVENYNKDNGILKIAYFY